MSSYQQTRFKVRTKAVVTGNQRMDLSNVLGPGGCKLLLGTLDQLEDGSSEVARAPGFRWNCVDRVAGHFSLMIDGGLPAGVQSMTVNLKLHGGLAEVIHEASYSVTQSQTTRDPASIPGTVHEQLRGTANRAVNRLLALTVATQVNRRMAVMVQQTSGVRVQNAVSMRLRNQNTIQSVARLRARGM